MRLIARKSLWRTSRSIRVPQSDARSLRPRGIPPGEYKIFAFEEIEPGAYQDADFLRPYEERGETLRVVEGGRHGARLKLISADVAPR